MKIWMALCSHGIAHDPDGSLLQEALRYTSEAATTIDPGS